MLNTWSARSTHQCLYVSSNCKFPTFLSCNRYRAVKKCEGWKCHLNYLVNIVDNQHEEREANVFNLFVEIPVADWPWFDETAKGIKKQNCIFTSYLHCFYLVNQCIKDVGKNRRPTFIRLRSHAVFILEISILAISMTYWQTWLLTIMSL